MQHGNYLVDIFDDSGQVTAQKPRRLVDKKIDIYHSVHVIAVTPWGELVLSSIPERDDLPNLYAEQFGTTVATIRRHEETADQAAMRALSRELNIADVQPRLLGEAWVSLDDGRRSYLSAYYILTTPPKNYSGLDIGGQSVVLPEHFRAMVTARPERFAPTLRAIWKRFGDQLPADKSSPSEL